MMLPCPWHVVMPLVLNSRVQLTKQPLWELVSTSVYGRAFFGSPPSLNAVINFIQGTKSEMERLQSQYSDSDEESLDSGKLRH